MPAAAIQKICVMGLGKLGSPIAASFACAGVNVIGYDLDKKKVDDINAGRAPVSEPMLDERIKMAGSFLTATTDPDEAVRGTDAAILVAPTPSSPDGSFDNQYLLSGIEKLGPAIKRERRSRPYTVIIASTVTPGSCQGILLPVLLKHSANVQLVYKPELIALGTVLYDLANPDVALIGAETADAAKNVFYLYARLNRGKAIEFKMMSHIEAELAKISLNCAVTMKISFANQVAMVAEQLGANPNVVLDFVGSDSRIGKKAILPGMPFGGPCFPRDCRMFRHVAQKVSIEPHLAIATDRINNDRLQYIFDSIPFDGDVGILGLSYKAGTSVTEESAGLALKVMLTAQGRTVKVHDPIIAPDRLEEAAGCRTVVVTTDYPEYRNIKVRSDQFVIDPMGIVKKRLAANQ